jgi:PAS domain S-box-containing protein
VVNRLYPDDDFVAPGNSPATLLGGLAGEAPYRALVEALGEIVWRTDPRGRPEPPQPSWSAFTGQSDAEVADNGWLDAIHPEDREAVRTAWARAAATGTRYGVEYRLRRHDGAWRRMQVRGVPVWGEDGMIREWVGLHEDITERRRTREALAETVRERTQALVATEARFQAYFEHAQDCLFDIEALADGGFAVRDCNPRAEATLNVVRRAVRGKGPEALFGPEAGARITAALRDCLARGKLRQDETLPTVSGVRAYDVILIAITGEGGERRILGTARDITERRELEARLAQAQKMQAMGELAGGIAHDINNVLQAVSSALALIARRHDEPDTVTRLARLGTAAAERGAAITRRLLAFARRDDLHAEPIDAAELLADMSEVLAHTLGPTIEIVVEADAGLPPLLADKGQIETVLVNLATNARDAMPEGGRLTFAAGAEHVGAHPRAPAALQPGDYVRLAVTDTGVGMDAATRARLTEPFFTTKPAGEGTGLGLAMARGFAEQSGGALAIVSAPGRGTTVTLWLPQVAAGPAGIAADRARTPIAPADPKRGIRVLLVEDDDLVRETLVAQLAAAGLLVLATRGAQDALALLQRGERIDLLVADHALPDLSGIALIERAQRLLPGQKALLLTGTTDIPAPEAGEAPFALLRKPVFGADLVNRILKLVESVAETRI